MCYGLYKALHADLHDDALIGVVQDGTVASHSEDGQRPQEIDAW